MYQEAEQQDAAAGASAQSGAQAQSQQQAPQQQGGRGVCAYLLYCGFAFGCCARK
jgi:hypothetical protein